MILQQNIIHYLGLRKHWISSKGLQVALVTGNSEVESYVVGGIKQDVVGKKTHLVDLNFEEIYF